MILDQFSLAGKIALVTGANDGIGQAIAVGLAEAGADILVAGSAVFGAADPADAVRQLAAL